MLIQRCCALLALVTALAAVYAQRRADADFWGHLRYGQLLLDHGGHIPEDPFAYTTAGRPWNDHESLSQMLLALAWTMGGPRGLILLEVVVAAGTLACLASCVRLSLADARLWAPLVMLLAVGVGRWFLFRPQLFTFLLLAVTLRIVFGHLLGPQRTRLFPLWLLPVLMPLWVNLHGGFLAGLGVLALGLGLRFLQGLGRGEGKWFTPVLPLALTLLACLAGTLLNPLGWRLWPYLATELRFAPNGKYIQEWLPLSFTGPDLWSALLVVVPLALLVGAVVLAQVRRRRVAGLAPWVWLLASAPVALMAFGSNRHAPVFALWLAPVLALVVSAALEGLEEGPVWSLGAGLLWSVAAVPALLMVRLVLDDPRPHIAVPAPSRAPAGLLAFLRANDLHGNLYGPLWWGSSLTWEAYPQVRVAMDGRNVTLFAPEDVAANLVFYHEADADCATPRRYPTDFLAMPAAAPVLPRVRADAHWVPLYEDAQVVLFVRADADHADLIRRARAGELLRGEPHAVSYLE